MLKQEWPPTQGELADELERLRTKGLLTYDPKRYPSLSDACQRADYVLANGDPDIERMLADVTTALGADIGRQASALLGVEPDLQTPSSYDRETEAAQRRGVGQRQFQKKYRDSTISAVARAIVKQFTEHTSLEDPSASSYKSPFKDWHEKAWVRHGHQHSYEFDRNLDSWPRDLVPVLKHPNAPLLNENQLQEILILSLYNYLHFTVELETGPVNYIANRIRDTNFLDWLPPTLKNDSLLIYTDEAGHAEMSQELMINVESYTGVAPDTVKPQFLRVLDKLKRERLPVEHDFVTLLFVIVSETLITGSLSKVPDDENVQTVVRDVTRDHAQDERRHHAYFAKLLPLIWQRLPAPLRHEAVLLLPHLLKAFLDIDRAATKRILDRYTSVFPHAGDALVAITSLPEVVSGIQQSAKPTLTLLTREGVMNEPGARDIFEKFGLLEKAAS